MAKAIVTGGAIRVGRAISLALAKQGYEIILNFNNSFEEAQELAREIKNKYTDCHLHKYNLAKKENIDKFFSEISQKYDDVTLLVNNASIFERYSFIETTEQIYDAHMDINLKTPFFMSQNFVRYITQKQYIEKSHIINISDTQTTTNNGSHFSYLLSKKSLSELTPMLAKDLAPKIRVNSISLGGIIPAESEDIEKFKKRAENTPLGKDPSINQVTEAILYLDKAHSITGQNIFVDSGSHLL